MYLMPGLTYIISLRLWDSNNFTFYRRSVCLTFSQLYCCRIPVLYVERLPIWPPQLGNWITLQMWQIQSVVRFPVFWLSVTTIKDLQMTAVTNSLTCFSSLSRWWMVTHPRPWKASLALRTTLSKQRLLSLVQPVLSHELILNFIGIG